MGSWLLLSIVLLNQIQRLLTQIFFPKQKQYKTHSLLVITSQLVPVPHFVTILVDKGQRKVRFLEEKSALFLWQELI